MKKQYAVITGDIIGSDNIRKEAREKLLDTLKNTFESIDKIITPNTSSRFEIYRGDSFQGLMESADKALLASILIRASLRRYAYGNTLNNSWDCRIAIGTGTIHTDLPKVTESDGEAFQNSGRTLDNMNKRHERLKIKTPIESINDEFNVACALSDTIINRWTTTQAEAIFIYLLEGKTQTEIGSMLNTSQKAISKRLDAGNIEAISLFINRYESIISKI